MPDLDLHGRALPLQPADAAAVFDTARDLFGDQGLVCRHPAGHTLQRLVERVVLANPPQQAAKRRHQGEQGRRKGPAQRA
ncbi:hypothetical protein SDC9_126600 [bioreactor metagenome]|uniref:Uncharacterized protein n=1 Tax=bioreactor metagenome TaxID=1076179 RepID=A0A645CS85_9ZZZZ